MRGPPALAAARDRLARGDAQGALADLAALPAPQPPGFWLLVARALLALGRAADAEAALRKAGAHLPARLALARLLFDQGRLGEALALLPPGEPDADPLRVRIRLRQGLVPLAEAAFREALTRVAKPSRLARLFALAAPVFGAGAAHAMATAAIRRALDGLDASGPDEATAAAVLSVRLRFTAGERTLFEEEAAALLASGRGGPLAPYLRAALAPPSPRPRVFVVGLSKTGTTSMNHALRRLGLLAAHWAHPLSHMLLRPGDAALLEAMSDTPVADAVEALAAAHPEARFILTLRPLESWLASLAGHHARHRRAPGIEELRRLVETPGLAPHGEGWRVLHRNLYTRHPDYATAYAAHLERVRRVFRDEPGRLLEFDVFAGDGYPKLAAFLGLPAPAEPFPHVNAAPGANLAAIAGEEA